MRKYFAKNDSVMNIYRYKSSLSALAIIIMFCCCTPKDRYVTFSGYAQGGTYTVKFNMNGTDGTIKKKPESIKHDVDSILQRIDNSLSGYNQNSIVSRFNAGETVTPDTLFLEIYSKAQKFHESTNGKVDIAAGPLFDLWGFGFKSGDMPSDIEVARARESSGMGRLKRNMREAMDKDGKISSHALLLSEDLAKDGLPVLNYNAIAQGYSCDIVAGYLYSLGVKDMLVDIGEIFCDGVNPSGKPWSLGIDKPIDGNQEPGAHLQGIFRAPEGPHGIVTSGNYRKYHIKDGRKYAHSIDPDTGLPVEHSLLSATIVAPDATTADAYATYCMVIGLEEAKSFISGNPGLEGCLIYDDNGVFASWCSDGFILEAPQQ